MVNILHDRLFAFRLQASIFIVLRLTVNKIYKIGKFSPITNDNFSSVSSLQRNVGSDVKW